jgi:hypothetical protein
MNVTVQMASGEVDEWEDAADTVVDHGAMVVVGSLTVEEFDEAMDHPETCKTITVKADGKSNTFRVHAVYAPGMWIKVEYS